MKKNKMKLIQYTVSIVVVIILLCGIFSIIKRLTGTSSTDKLSNNISKEQEDVSEKEVDNSVPMTKLSVGVPEGTIRVGETMKLDIAYEPKNATNTELKWSCSEKGAVTVSEDGILTPSGKAAKSTVTVTAKATDGSDLSTSFELRIYPEIDPSKPMVAITFDDGPYEPTTTPILDALEENYAKATFFCLGQNVGYYPNVVQREYELGMEVGTHTTSHKQLTTLSATELEKEITDSIVALKDAIGVEPKLMRPPFGSVNKDVLTAVGNHGLCCVNWSLDTEDWKTKNADATYRMVMTATDGDVVLLHDIHEYNVAAVERFVKDLQAEGFQLVTVSEMYEARGETLDPGTIHYRTDPTTEASGETTAASQEDGADISEEESTDTTAVSDTTATEQ